MQSMSRGVSMQGILSLTLLMADDIAKAERDPQREEQPASPRRRFSCSQALSRWLISGPPLFYLILFFAIPTLIMAFAAFRYPGDYGGLAPMFDDSGALDLTLENFKPFFGDFIYTGIFLKSLLFASITTLACLTMAYPLSLLIARSPKKWRNLLVLLVILPFWSNFLIRIYAWMILLGPQSALTRGLNAVLGVFGFEPVALLYSAFAVIVGLVYVHLPFMVLPLYADLEKHDPALLDAAQDLGAGKWQSFWRVTFPLSLPGIYAGSALVFIPALGIFAVSDILGGTGGIMIGNVIKQQFLESRDWPFGSVLSIMLTVAALAAAGFAVWLARPRRTRSPRSRRV
jgi:spermidine/putrescine transport system permease protein